MAQTILSDGNFAPLPGWPCAPFLGGAPSVADRLTAPTAETLLPQILPLTPRGAAWGTDEAGDGQGASPLQLGFWTSLAAWAAAQFTRDADIAAQTFPSLVTWSLDDWENDYALPDRCIIDPQNVAQRLQALRVKYALVGASSPDYLICLAASLGYAIVIEEYQPLRCDDFRAGYYCFGLPWGDVFKVHVPVTTVVPLYCDSFHAGDRVETWRNSQLECALGTAAQPQTAFFFAFDIDADGSPLAGFTLDDGTSGSGDPLT